MLEKGRLSLPSTTSQYPEARKTYPPGIGLHVKIAQHSGALTKSEICQQAQFKARGARGESKPLVRWLGTLNVLGD